MNKVYIATFKGIHPVGASGYVVAPDRERATVLLNIELEARGLESICSTDLALVDLVKEHAVILTDGDY